jgi:CRISPR-associated protein Csb2
MVAIEVELLTGNYVATEFNERNQAEWPPHPARLFAALVATWADADEPDSHERAALTTLERFAPPSISCDAEPAFRAVVTHYVPDNDVRAASRNLSASWAEVDELRAEVLRLTNERAAENLIIKAQMKLDKRLVKLAADSVAVTAAKENESDSVRSEVLEVLPHERGRQARTYPVVIPESPTIRFVWEDDLSEDETRSIDAVCSRLARLGHSSSMVSARVIDRGAQIVEPTFVPGEGRGSQPIRVAADGMLDRLEYDFLRHQGCEPRVTASKSALYRPATNRAEQPSSNLSGELIALPWPDLRSRPYSPRTLSLTRALRGALMHYSDQPPPPVLSGHQPGRLPTAPSTSPHAAFLALPAVGYPNSDGRIMGLGILLPQTVDPNELAGVYRALSAWLEDGGRLNPTDGRTPANFASENSELSVALRRDRWAGRRGGHRRWVSVTPVALDRYPGDPRRQGDDAMNEAARIIATSCAHVGLPPPISVETTFQPLISGSRSVRSFPGMSTGSNGAKRAAVHATIEFDQPISGPLVLGAGRYLGYGLFAPLVDEDGL